MERCRSGVRSLDCLPERHAADDIFSRAAATQEASTEAIAPT